MIASGFIWGIIIFGSVLIYKRYTEYRIRKQQIQWEIYNLMLLTEDVERDRFGP